ncbi:MAG: protein kinase [Candidatus Aminicenantaceae bacterium]
MGIKCPKCQTENPDTSSYCADCGTQLGPSKDISVTKTIETPKEELTRGSIIAGRYEIIEELGKGGMGRIYRVEDTKLKQEVALKLIKPEIAEDKKTIERFRNELKIARNIRHKNVCGMFDLGEAEGTHFIMMEYIRGEDLKSFIHRSGQLTIGTAIRISKQVCEGLDEAHRLGVMHRDLKSSNIMIDREGNARIMDFGIARSLKEKGITGAGVMIGTPEYMSPEQVEAKDIDERSDIYSLGIILYEMTTGKLPFEADTPFAVGVKQKSENPRDPRELNPQIPEDLCRVVLKCLEKDKGQRYQSAGEVRSELENIEKGIPTSEKVIPKRKPLTSKEITVTFGLKKLLIPALAVFAFIIAAVIIWQLIPKREIIPAAPSDKPSLAVMYFKNNTGDGSFDIWRSALSDSIITDLSQSKFIQVLSSDRLYSVLRKLNLTEAKTYASEDLKEVAAEGKVNHILQGSLSKAGETFRIEYTLQDIRTGEAIGSERIEGKGEESIFSLVDELTRRVKVNFKLTEEEIASDIDKEVGKITTSSPEAYKNYIEGVIHFNRRDARKSIQFLKKATEIDPEFASAYRTLSIAYSNLGYRAERKKYLKKAMELSDRISERERYRIEAEHYSYSEKTYDKAIDTFNKLLQLYPEAGYARNNLGSKYMDLELWDKAIEQYQWHIQNKVDYHQPYGNIAAAYMAKGIYEKAKEILEFYLDNISDHPGIRYSLARSYLAQGKYELALVEADKGLSVNPAFFLNQRIKADIYHLKGELLTAEKEYLKLIESREPAAHAWGLAKLASLYFTQGRFKEAKELLERGIDWSKEVGEKWAESNFHWYLGYAHLKSGSPESALKEFEDSLRGYVEAESFGAQRFVRYLEGVGYLEMNSIEQAQKAAAELKKFIEEGMNRKAIRHYHHLMGRIELKKESFTKAVENFKKAISLLPFQRNPTSDYHALFIEPLALAYYKQGELEKARYECERIISLTLGRLGYGDIYAKSFYMLGKIYEQQDSTGKAIEHYQKFLDLWKDADPGIAEVKDAKKRLAGLKELT